MAQDQKEQQSPDRSTHRSYLLRLWQETPGGRDRALLQDIVGCGVLLPTGFQPSKGGDMACIRGRLGACAATYHNMSNGRGTALNT